MLQHLTPPPYFSTLDHFLFPTVLAINADYVFTHRQLTDLVVATDFFFSVMQELTSYT
jgi:hypothetical protein